MPSPGSTAASRRSSGSASIPSSYQEPGSTSGSMRSRAVWRPDAWILAHRLGPARGQRLLAPARELVGGGDVCCWESKGLYRPSNRGSRRALKASMPSWKSSLPCRIRHRVDRVLGGPRRVSAEHLLAHRERERRAGGDLWASAVRPATCSPGGVTRLTSPASRASCASIISPVRTRNFSQCRFACGGPRTTPRPGTSPTPPPACRSARSRRRSRCRRPASARSRRRARGRGWPRSSAWRTPRRRAARRSPRSIGAPVGGAAQLAEPGDVAADREAAPRAAEDRARGPRVGLGALDHRAKLRPEVARHCVELVGAVEHRPCHRTLDGVGQHSSSFTSRRTLNEYPASAGSAKPVTFHRTRSRSPASM